MSFSYEKYLNGEEFEAYKYFGFHFDGNFSIFRVYAKNADAVGIIGEFNNWQRMIMNEVYPGVFELKFNTNLENTSYKYQINFDDYWHDKADPYAFYSETRPGTASKCYVNSKFNWTDEKYFNQKLETNLNVYEIHLGSWKKSLKNYRDIANELVPYLISHNFTHVEIMPINEHPFDGSWGYQVTGYFSITSRYGSLDDFKYFVNLMHENNIGVIIDWVPLHFVKDEHGLINFDGDNLYEYPFDDFRESSEWGTLFFDLGKGHVQSFLISSAIYLMNEFHIDGLRVDAVNYMIYYHGNSSNSINEYAINFIKKLNSVVHLYKNDFIMIAEDSSAYPNVTNDLGLNFDLKWNFGWMHDTLKYFSLDFNKRKVSANLFTFASMYYMHENYILMFSHDEVVHGKNSIINKIFGSYQEKFMQLRCLYMIMMTFPGYKGNFMGNELASFDEFNENNSINFDILDYDTHRDFNLYFKELTKLYVNNKSLGNNHNFTWNHINESDCVFSYSRDEYLIVVNLSNNVYNHYGISCTNNYQLVLETNFGNNQLLYQNNNDNIYINLDKLSGYIFRRIL